MKRRTNYRVCFKDSAGRLWLAGEYFYEDLAREACEAERDMGIKAWAEQRTARGWVRIC